MDWILTAASMQLAFAWGIFVALKPRVRLSLPPAMYVLLL